MKSKYKQVNYVEWRSTEEMHDNTIEWLSDLEFVKVEQGFLEELIKENTLYLISGDTFTKSKAVVTKLSGSIKKVNALHKRVLKHSNELEVLLDDVKETKKEQLFKTEHDLLNAEIFIFLNNYRNIKNEIFELIKNIMKINKQKRLLK